MKKSRNPMQIVAVVFLIIIFFFMGSILLRMITKNVLVEKLGINNSVTDWILTGVSIADVLDEATGEYLVSINWAEKYPYKTEEVVNEQVAKQNTLLTTYQNKINHIEAVLGDYCNEYLLGRTDLVESAYVYEELQGWSLIPIGSDNGIIIKDNGYLTYVDGRKDATDMVTMLTDFNQYLEEKDIPLLYVQAPAKVSPENPDLPAGVTDYTNNNMDNLLVGLDENGVDYLDLREYIVDNYENYEEAFFKTDHHWKTTTAFEAATQIAGYMQENYGFDIPMELYEKENYNLAVYEDYFLGSQGKKVTLGIVEPEDYMLMEPQFDTSFAIEIPEREIDTTGSLQEVLLDYRHLEEIDYYGENCYASFMNRNDAFARIKNLGMTEGKKILIIKDSYSTPLIPYLSLGVEEVVSLYKLLFNGSIRTLIEEEQPDAVIVCYSSTSMGEGTSRSAFYNME